jgi:hypothetical protein
MGKRAKPKYLSKRIKCKCGLWFYQVLIGSTQRLSDGCSICKPEQYVKQKEKK